MCGRLPSWMSTISTHPLAPLTSAGRCIHEANKLNNRIRNLVDPPQLEGVWVSSACEMMPDREFALRFVQFYDDGRFLLRQHRYYDQHCSHPTVSICGRSETKPKTKTKPKPRPIP